MSNNWTQVSNMSTQKATTNNSLSPSKVSEQYITAKGVAAAVAAFYPVTIRLVMSKKWTQMSDIY